MTSPLGWAYAAFELPIFHPIRAPVATCALAVASIGFAHDARASPGQAKRLSGVEAQGPATASVTGLHHNPAMLAAIGSTEIDVSIRGGLEHQHIRRFGIDPRTGTPRGELGQPVTLVNPELGYFAGISFFLDPIALGIGVYDLSSRYRIASDDLLRYHLAPDPSPNCFRLGLRACPPDGGSVTMRQDITGAIAWDIGPVQFGAAVHFPRLRQRFAFDNDTELHPAPEGTNVRRCADKEDPRCTERVGFRGWTQWIPRNGAPPGFDAALTFGFAVSVSLTKVSPYLEATFGARYRTFPLRRAGRVDLGGSALVCRPNSDAVGIDVSDEVLPCDQASPVGASLSEKLPQEVALGFSLANSQPSAQWRVDTNLYWTDECPGGAAPASCGDDSGQRLQIVGLDRQTFVLPQFERYLGRQDVYGVEVFGAYEVRSYKFLLGGLHFNSPPVRRGARTAAYGDGWQLGLSMGAKFVLPSGVSLTPGYGLDVGLPQTIRASSRFRPQDAIEFYESGGDLNRAGAQAVLEGRGRSTNAGRYVDIHHTFTFTVRWRDSEGG